MLYDIQGMQQENLHPSLEQDNPWANPILSLIITKYTVSAYVSINGQNVLYNMWHMHDGHTKNYQNFSKGKTLQ